MTMTTPTPGRRLHAALLAHGIVEDGWDGMRPSQHADYEAAAREHGGGPVATEDAPPSYRASARYTRPCEFMRAKGCALPTHVDPGPVPDEGDALAVRVWWHSDDLNALFAALDRLAAEVATLRRDREMDLAAFSEIGDRLGRCEQLAGDAYGRDLGICDQMGDDRERLARCEGRDGEIIDRLRRVEMLADRRMGEWDNLNSRLDALESLAKVDKDTDVSLFGMYGKLADRLAALEARARDGGDPPRRGPMPFRNDDMPTPDGFYRVIVDEIRALPWTTGQDGMFRCVSDEVWRARITPLLRRLDHEMTDGEGSDLADVVLGIDGGDPLRRTG